MIHILYAADVANSTTAPEFGSSPTIRVALFGAQAERHGWENSGNGALRKSAIAQDLHRLCVKSWTTSQMETTA
jgi:hypothetical protein